MHDGWTIRTSPGEPMVFEKSDKKIRPFELMQEISRGDLKHEAWEKRCEQLGIANLPLALEERQSAATAS
ncbi:MAG: hypothetical protein ACXVZX_05150 [Terriglobales bacterium]